MRVLMVIVVIGWMNISGMRAQMLDYGRQVDEQGKRVEVEECRRKEEHRWGRKMKGKKVMERKIYKGKVGMKRVEVVEKGLWGRGKEQKGLKRYKGGDKKVGIERKEGKDGGVVVCVGRDLKEVVKLEGGKEIKEEVGLREVNQYWYRRGREEGIPKIEAGRGEKIEKK